ncbi:MAG: DUF1629 domain-containing protein [Xanthobacteraceae bacterium]|nr:DUF1629 domain-containing protein [Xanthobacteraceae bacterium]
MMNSVAKSSTTETDPDAAERRYFELNVDFRLPTFPSVDWTNESTLRTGLRTQDDKPFRGIQFSEPPKIVVERKNRRGPLRDAYSIDLGIWLVSDRTKLLFEQMDREAFAFERAEVNDRKFVEPSPAFWLCHIVRMLDCVDEEQSKILYQEDIPFKNYLRLIDVKMRREVIGAAHAFRPKYAARTDIVDDVLATAIKREKIRGFGFVEIQRPST